MFYMQALAGDECLLHRFCAHCVHLEHPLPSNLQELKLQIESCDTVSYHIKRAAEGLEGELYHSIRSLFSQFLILLSVYIHINQLTVITGPPQAASFCWLCCFILIIMLKQREAPRCVRNQVITVY